MSRRVRVHHFVVANLARPENQSWRVWDLFRVSHWIDVPADIEFPYTVPRMQLFTRFFLTRARATNFRVRVLWDDHPSGIPEVIGDFGLFVTSFARDAVVHDRSFNLHHLQLKGVGEHSVELLREKRLAWTADEWIPIAKTFFFVER